MGALANSSKRVPHKYVKKHLKRVEGDYRGSIGFEEFQRSRVKLSLIYGGLKVNILALMGGKMSVTL